MMHDGLALTARYAYPPNSLSLCGPEKQQELIHYTSSQEADAGTVEILEQFSTLYPYLCFIAGENHLKDPFDTTVVDAYWTGNSLLNKTRTSDFLHFFKEDSHFSRKISKANTDNVAKKISLGALPHHAFHVLNIYKRTGNIVASHTIQTMDACIINWGKIIKKSPNDVIVETHRLELVNETLLFGPLFHRKLRPQGEHDSVFSTLKEGDVVSYHWGYVCEKLSKSKLKNLITYTNQAVHFANSSL